MPLFFLECHHAIGKPPGSPVSEHVWERITLGDGRDAGFTSLGDPALVATRDTLLTRPDIIGVRVVFQTDQPTPQTFQSKPSAMPGQPPVAPTDGQIVATTGL